MEMNKTLTINATHSASGSDCSALSFGDPTFRDEIRIICGENVLSCYQCGECTAGCPVAFAMDIAPNQVMRMVQVGMRDEVLGSSAIWLCAGCETCRTRCPKGVGLSKVMDACRQIAVQSGIKAKEPNILKFHEEFLKEIARNGRVHEMSLVAFYKLRSKRFFDDMLSGTQMFLKGKLGLIPSRVKRVAEVRKLFKLSANR
jgi:heterodisulfide reductase subunit C